MNNTPVNRTSGPNQDSPTADKYTYSARYKASRLQSANARGSNSDENLFKGRPSSFASDSALPDIKEKEKEKRRNSNSSVNNTKSKPFKRVMSNENVGRVGGRPPDNFSSHNNYMDNGYANNYGRQNNVPNYNDAEPQYMKPFIDTYPDSRIPRHNRTINRVPSSESNTSSLNYSQTAAYYEQGNVQQQPSIQQSTHRSRQDYGGHSDRRDMQPPGSRSPKRGPGYDNKGNSGGRTHREPAGGSPQRSGDQGRGQDRSPQRRPSNDKGQGQGKVDNSVQYVIKNRSKNNTDESPQNKQTKGNQQNKSDKKTTGSPKANRKGYNFPEVADVDDFNMDDIGAEYQGNDIYLCYLKTDAGDVIGPLRLDIEDVQLGLPKFDKKDNKDSGMRNRQSGSHGLNEFSSRSHSMLTLTVDTEQVDPDDENLYLTKRGKLTFVDLAGSEKVKDSNSSAEMLIESNNINRSLLVLGNCISSLGDPKKRQGHIPYRDSKLTKLLADSLGGNGVTLMIACVTPSAYHVHETTNTLRYASRAKRIKSKPVVKMDPREKLILSLKREIKILRQENHYLREQLEFPAKPKGDLQKNNDEKFMKMVKDMQSKASSGDRDLYAMLQEYMIENEALRNENSELHRNKDQLHRDQQSLSKQNEKLLNNLESMQRSLDKARHNNNETGVPYRSPQGSGHHGYNGPAPQRLPQNQGYVSPNTGRGKPPPSHGQPKRPPHRLSEPLMRPAQLPPEHMQNGYVDEGYMSPRGRPPIQNGGMRQGSDKSKKQNPH